LLLFAEAVSLRACISKYKGCQSTRKARED
jgi:hypothetical protein